MYGYHSGIAGPSFGPGYDTPSGLLADLLNCGGPCDPKTTAVAVGSFILGAMILNILGKGIVVCFLFHHLDTLRHHIMFNISTQFIVVEHTRYFIIAI